MKSQISDSKKDFYRKQNARTAANIRVVLQLYACYKAETVIKSEPRIPRNHPRREFSSHKPHSSLFKLPKLFFTSNHSYVVESGRDIQHAAVAPLFKKLMNKSKVLPIGRNLEIDL
jgi:hypothetical protein